jgi:hypothetical protein
MKMKKIKQRLGWFIIGSLLLCFPLTSQADTQKSDTTVSSQMLHDTLLTLLTPNIDKAVTSIYKEDRPYDLFNARVEAIKRPQEGGFHFIVIVTIHTFEGAHSPPYGRDQLTFDVTPGQVTFLHFNHQDIQARL